MTLTVTHMWLYIGLSLFFPCFRYGSNNQYALGINVPVRYCNQVAAPDQNFLQQDKDERKVKADMAGDDRIYKGVQLIGAKPKPIKGMSANFHSEYLLLIKSMSEKFTTFDPLMMTLLNSDSEGCSIFLTLNSPCVNTCSTPSGRYSIIPALKMFRNRKGPKAFVFKQVWEHDVARPAWKKNIKEINKEIPVYRCDNIGCILCVNSGEVNQRCTQN